MGCNKQGCFNMHVNCKIYIYIWASYKKIILYHISNDEKTFSPGITHHNYPCNNSHFSFTNMLTYKKLLSLFLLH